MKQSKQKWTLRTLKLIGKDLKYIYKLIKTNTKIWKQ